MRLKAKQQVSPKATAAILLTVIVVIQVTWWQGLVVKPKAGGPSGMMGGGGGSAGGPPTLIGRKDVLVTTLVGTPEPGDTDGPGYGARLDSPVGLALDGQGNLYVADSRNHKIRQIAPGGKTTTLAGSGPGFADGPALQAKFNLPCGVAVAPDGAVYVADTGNHRIRRIQNGQVTTLAGSDPGMAEGQGAAVKFNAPCGVTFVAGKTPFLYVADAQNHRVRVLDLNGKITGGWAVPGAPASILAGAAPVVSVPQAGISLAGGKLLRNIPMDTQDLPAKAEDFTIEHPLALSPAPQGWFVVAATQGGVFYVKDGKAELIAGHTQGKRHVSAWVDGGGHLAYFGQVSSIVGDGKGHLYVSDTGNNSIRRLTLPEDLR